jgi:hypothetical protein
MGIFPFSSLMFPAEHYLVHHTALDSGGSGVFTTLMWTQGKTESRGREMCTEATVCLLGTRGCCG